jgi:hypothetical protein
MRVTVTSSREGAGSPLPAPFTLYHLFFLNLLAHATDLGATKSEKLLINVDVPWMGYGSDIAPPTGQT